MNEKVPALLAFLIPVALLSAVPAYAQNGVVYSPQEYPTAQGHYLALPQSYQSAPQQPAPQPPPQIRAYQPLPPQPSPVYVPPPPSPPPAVAASPAQYQAVPLTGNVVQYVPISQQPPSNPTTFEQLPAFSDDHSLDPRYVPKPPPPRAPPPQNQITLGTENGGEFGLQLSDYRYQEFDVSGNELMRITGPNIGLTLTGNRTLANNWFLTGGVRLAYGLHDYTGGDINLFSQVITPSTHNDISDWLGEVFIAGGRDFIFPDAFWDSFAIGLSPYIGLGFRYLYDDMTGNDSNGVPGYDRYSHYLYLPIGITPRVRLADRLRLSLNMEFDPLLYGWQVSSLGEAISGGSDVTNTQTSGYGLRGSMMFEWPHWSIGPFFNFWDIGQSTTDCDNQGDCGYEPHNQTLEYGIQGRYRF